MDHPDGACVASSSAAEVCWGMDTLARRIRELAVDEGGVALVLTLLIVSALTISTAAVAGLMISNEKSFGRDRQEVLAVNAAEAGLNYGLSTLAATVDPTGSVGYGSEAWYPTTYQSSGTTVPFDDSAGKGSWWANKIDANTWRLYAIGRSPNGHVTRKVSMKVRSATEPGTLMPASSTWSKGLFVGKPGPSCFTPTGARALRSRSTSRADQVLGQRGDRRAEHVDRPLRAGIRRDDDLLRQRLGVDRDRKQEGVLGDRATRLHGQVGKDLQRVRLKRLCAELHRPLAEPTKPPIYPGTTYALGKWSTPTCSTGSFIFDNNTTRDSSIGTVDLFPSTAYDCRVYNASSIEVGRLAWNRTHSLIVTGTIFIDGSLKMNSNTAAGYTTPSGTTPLGATIYVNETVSMNGTASLCGPPSVPNGGGCSGHWDGTYGAIVVVAVNASNSSDPFAVGWNANGNAYYD